MSKPKFKVAVCGGGAGGLTFAVAMSRYPDVEVEIFEAASEFSPIGAGIGIWPRAWKALVAIGIKDLAQYASKQPSDDSVCTLELRKSDQANGYAFSRVITNGEYTQDLMLLLQREPHTYILGTLLFFHRADFQAVLVKHLLPSCQIQYSKRLETYRRLKSGELEVIFDDHSTSRCDLLVGADGIKSAVRRTFLHEQAQNALAEGRTADASSLLAAVHPVWTGTLAYRALVPVDKLSNHVVHDYGTQYLGKTWVYMYSLLGLSPELTAPFDIQAIIAYPVARGTLINIVASHTNDNLTGTPFDGPWIEDAEKDDILSATSHWEPEFVELTQGIDKLTRWAIHTVRPLRSFVSDGIALLGDAAHAMAPHQGSGAGQAIEDGCLLAELLGHPSVKRETLPIVLRIYDALRRPFALDIAQRSFEYGRYLSLIHADFSIDEFDAHDEVERLQKMGEVIVDKWRWAWETSLDDMIHQAMSTLEEEL